MATTTSITTTYAGEKLQGFISAALLSANTIENGGVNLKAILFVVRYFIIEPSLSSGATTRNV